MNAIELAIFASRLEAVCDEMGSALKRAAFSANIKDRLDFSCAVFDAAGDLCAQAAHIPVHLGSMAYAMQDLVEAADWQEGDMMVLNDPYLGGTHLPDVTLIQPAFCQGELVGFVANRAHHANIGAAAPGSMPVSTDISQEGVLISPVLLFKRGELVPETVQLLSAIEPPEACHQGLPLDFWAQISANRLGVSRLIQEVETLGAEGFSSLKEALFDYGNRLAASLIASIPDGDYTFDDVMESDGVEPGSCPICVRIRIRGEQASLDFAGTGKQVAGNINCPRSVTAAAVYYVFKSLMPPQTPNCAGAFRGISFEVPAGSILNAGMPAAVAAGNVETSSRVVDVVLGALAQAIPDRIPAASQGTMNNVAMGSRQAGHHWDYYETLGGGMGAGARYPGVSAVQTHMTNTLNTPIESVELEYPLRINAYRIRRGSGGSGESAGGNGLVRSYEFLQETEVTLLTERRHTAPYGLAGGAAGHPGENRLNGELLEAKCSVKARRGDVLTIATPGGGGWGDSGQGKNIVK